MAIITIDEYKAYPYYTSSQTDAHINIFIQDVEEAYLTIRNLPFYVQECDITSGSADIETSDDTDWIENNMRVSGTGITEGSLVTFVDDGTVTISNAATASNDAVTVTFYPIGAKGTAAKMIKYLFDNQYRDDNLVSESIEKHTMSFASGDELIEGYPKSIVGRIKRFHGFV